MIRNTQEVENERVFNVDKTEQDTNDCTGFSTLSALREADTFRK